MSRAVAAFINIDILCKAAIDSGCDVVTPLKPQQCFTVGLLFNSLSVCCYHPRQCSLFSWAFPHTVSHWLTAETRPNRKSLKMKNSLWCEIWSPILVPAWHGVEIICRDASHWTARWTVSIVGKAGTVQNLLSLSSLSMYSAMRQLFCVPAV